MQRTLLPVFAKTCYAITEEPKENFSFLPADTRYDYEAFRDALDSVPGSRDYLMNYKKPEDGYTFYDDIGNKILSRAGSHHSGASAVILAWSYKNLLNDWDAWVENTKIHQLKKAYKEAQLERVQTRPFSYALMAKNSELLYYSYDIAKDEEKILEVATKLKADLSLTYSPQEIIVLMTDLVAEFEREATETEVALAKQRYEALLEVLEHHDKFPQRWDDFGKGSLKSHLFSSIYDINPGMYEDMEKRCPGFTKRIQAIIAASKIEC